MDILNYSKWKRNFLLVASIFISSCDGEALSEIKEVILHSKFDQRVIYKLTVPSEDFVYLEDGGRLMVKVIHPEMTGFSDANRNRFYAQNGTWGKDLIRVFVDIYPEYELDDREFKNRNDAGRFAYYGMIAGGAYIETDHDLNFTNKDNVRVFENKVSGTKKHFVSYGDGRMTTVSCVMDEPCKALTTWRGELHILYQFSVEKLENIVNLDSSVFLLIDKYNPTLISS